jgi:nucleotide-binding universal stress UspA family protein
MYSTVTVGTDGAKAAADALTLARTLTAPDGRLLVVCVRPPDPPFEPEVGVRRVIEADHVLDAARVVLEDDGRAEYLTPCGSSAAAELHALALEHGADLIVVGSSHRGGLGRVLLGSVTRAVLDGAPASVAIAPVHLQEHVPLELAQVGVGFDGTAESEVALQAAAAFARAHHAHLRILSAADVGDAGPVAVEVFPTPELVTRMATAADARVATAVTRLGGPEHVAGEVLTGGSTVEQLVRASSELDVLFLGSRETASHRRTLLGSVSARIADAAACPVVVVPQGAERP